MATKQARVSWKGDLESGDGTIEQVGSGAFGPLAVSWPARTGDESGMTSPEELIAAAHASCFSMAISARLGKAGMPPERLEVSATVTFVPGTGITTSELDVTGVVPGVYGLKQLLVGAGAGGLGSGRALEQPAVVVR